MCMSLKMCKCIGEKSVSIVHNSPLQPWRVATLHNIVRFYLYLCCILLLGFGCSCRWGVDTACTFTVTFVNVIRETCLSATLFTLNHHMHTLVHNCAGWGKHCLAIIKFFGNNVHCQVSTELRMQFERKRLGITQSCMLCFVRNCIQKQLIIIDEHVIQSSSA